MAHSDYLSASSLQTSHHYWRKQLCSIHIILFFDSTRLPLIYYRNLGFLI